jgi:hypothetical protein
MEYVLGSDQLPEIQFGKVDFDSQKFMTDLVNDHVPAKSKGEQQKAGAWKEAEVAPPPPPTPGPAKLPGAKGEGGKLKDPKTGEKVEKVPSKETAKSFADGMKAVGELAERSERHPFDEADIRAALKAIRRKYGFRTLEPIDEGEAWGVDAQMNPDGKPKKKIRKGTQPGARPSVAAPAPALRGDPWSPEAVEQRRAAAQQLYGPQAQRAPTVRLGERVPPPRELVGFPEAVRGRPKTPVQGGGGLRARWIDPAGNIYEWDSQHGSVEKYRSDGKHLGEFDPQTGTQTKPANPNRSVEP